MGFWRKELIDPALDEETRRHMQRQIDWIGREPANPRPYHQLALLYRMQWKQDEALGLLLEAVGLDEAFAPAHLALAEIYAVRSDYPAAWRHARLAQQHGDGGAVAMLERHRVAEPGA